MHLPLRKLDRDARTSELLHQGERRPEWYLPLWPYLYRIYDADVRPLYIGISSCTPLRLDGHRRQSQWWPLAEYIAISVYPSSRASEEAERAAIKHEQPRGNKKGLRGPATVPVPAHGSPEEAAAVLFRQTTAEFVAELAALLAQPDRFPQPEPPPPARFADEGES